MSRIKPNNLSQKSSVEPKNTKISPLDNNVMFSFELLDKNDYFNLDKTCQNWSADLFDTLQKVSGFTAKDIVLGKYAKEGSPFRIHNHKDKNPPCPLPVDKELEDMWQIRISVNKGGVHGFFIDNYFYVIWFDPQHNWYPNKDKGGLTRIRIPAQSCCKERDDELVELNTIIMQLQNDIKERDEVIHLFENP